MNTKAGHKEFTSRSPFGKEYYVNSDGIHKINAFLTRNKRRKVVAIQGLGFVGSAMLTAVANAQGNDGLPLYAVIGVDLPKPQTYWKVGMINEGRLPIESVDRGLTRAFNKAFKAGNIIATTEKYAYANADIIIVDINLDVIKYPQGDIKKSDVIFTDFISAIREIAMHMKPDCLVIVESTVPVGTCEKVLFPLFREEFKKRGYKDFKVNLGHSYERVMPGRNYLKSITSYYRVFSGIDEKSKKKTRKFLETIIDTRNYRLTELHSTTASEMGKILENSFRATNIAFIQEWTEFAELAGVNLYDVIAGIRKRDTHRNIMLPGFGVGGFCLPKDPLLGDWSARRLFGSSRHLDLSVSAVKINDKMPLHSFSILKHHLKTMHKKRILLMGISYLNDVADTRFSPSEIFYKECKKNGANVILHDPIVRYWNELCLKIPKSIKSVRNKKVDAIVMALNHRDYFKMNAREFLQLLKPGGLILDCNNVISDKKAKSLRSLGYRIYGVGKGHWILRRSEGK
jgi:nucleotide sugar dehydrogenase